MAGIPHDHYEPKSSGEKWLHKRLPIVGLLYDTLMIPTPKNLNWMWIWGIVLTFCLALQIITGIVLVMEFNEAKRTTLVDFNCLGFCVYDSKDCLALGTFIL